MKWFSFVISFATGTLYGKPVSCILCGAHLNDSNMGTEGICTCCCSALRQRMTSVCQICGIPVKSPLTLCQVCTGNMFYYDMLRSCGEYEGELKKAIMRMKYYGERWLSRPLGQLMGEWVDFFHPVDLIVPVPLEPGRLLHRGFNQACDLGEELSKHTGIPAADILCRSNSSVHQTQLTRNKRWEQISNSMKLKSKVDLSFTRVLVVDDVATTGATLDEAARVLKNSGASKVFGLTVARTERI
jgi:competence protein ComFC